MSQDQNIAIYNHFFQNIFPTLRSLALLGRYSADAELQNHPNPLTKAGAKVYSQNEEDGITFEILRRLNIDKGVFGEFGVGDGTENNTLALAARGWKGFWVGNQDLAFDHNPDRVESCAFSYKRGWIKQSNIVDLCAEGLVSVSETQCHLISLDLDGNDYHFVKTLLEAGALPEVFIVEYNGRFLPPIEFVMDYNEEHNWDGSDHYGGSLSSFVNLFEKHGYFLACCNITGLNAFFIKSTHKHLFNDVPSDIRTLFGSPKYFLTNLDVAGHPVSKKTIETIFRNLHAAYPVETQALQTA
jgi:hypothetical protein